MKGRGVPPSGCLLLLLWLKRGGCSLFDTKFTAAHLEGEKWKILTVDFMIKKEHVCIILFSDRNNFVSLHHSQGLRVQRDRTHFTSAQNWSSERIEFLESWCLKPYLGLEGNVFPKNLQLLWPTKNAWPCLQPEPYWKLTDWLEDSRLWQCNMVSVNRYLSLLSVILQNTAL